MRKKLLSLALALVMCLGLTVPAFAAEPFTYDKEDSLVRVTNVLKYEEKELEYAEEKGLSFTCAAPASFTPGNIFDRAEGKVEAYAIKMPEWANLTIDNYAEFFDYAVDEDSGNEITASDGESIILTESGCYIVWVVTSTATGNSSYRACLVNVQPATTTPTTVGNFTDVKTSDYFAEPVLWAVEKGITAGTSSTTFSPNQDCTVAQILTFLWRANGSPKSSGSNPFTDVKSGDYYADAAAWAYEKGMVSGSTFGGNTPCTRSMAVTYMWKAAGSPSAKAASFTDVSTGAEYASAVAWAVEQGVTAGTSADTFSPDSVCTRGQIATFLYRGLAE